MSSSLLNQELETLLANDKTLLEQTQFPIVTVSSTFREDLKQYYGLEHDPNMRDVVFSRAHYSMAYAVAAEAWLGNRTLTTNITPDPAKAWFVDPTNYVQSKDWAKIQNVEYVGRTLARNKMLQGLKDMVDKYLRGRLPITSAITPSLLHLFQRIDKPIISMHYEAGNILASVGKKIVQVITDPHVRDQYLTYADLPNMRFCVFDEKTKSDFMEKAGLLNKKVSPDHVFVTGSPIDPRIIAARKKKSTEIPHSRPIRICITTGGLGTNKQEIRVILEQLFDFLRQRPSPIQLLCYAGTQHDFTTMIQEIAKQERVAIEPLQNEHANLRLIHGKHIVELNEELIRYGFPWADGFITKPSGDMAYDVAASGSFLLFLSPWGEWENNVEAVFEQDGIGRKAEVKHIKEQVEILRQRAFHKDTESWFESAKKQALSLPPAFLHGTREILKVAEEWK